MRILIISTHDSRGGAGKAVYRFAKEFDKRGHEVCLFVREKKESDDFIRITKSTSLYQRILHILDFLPGYILNGFNKDTNFTLGLFGENIENIIENFRPDVINIHWCWKGFISFPKIVKISRNVPVVWTLHDFSAFSGGIFVPGTGENVLIKAIAKINNFYRKQLLKKSNIVFVSPSKFLFTEFSKSKLISNKESVLINNGVSLETFAPIKRDDVRASLKLDLNKKYILFGALNMVEDSIKGGVVLDSVFHKLESYFIKKQIGLISFGSRNPFPSMGLSSNIETRYFGFVSTDEEMAKIYSAADIMVVPSKCENYPFVVMESLCCFTPVVAFNVGGIPEMIKNSVNGYLVQPYEIDDFASNIKKALEDPLIIKDVSGFNIDNKTQEYLNLFKEIS